MMASVDVIVPCYNYGRFLRDSVGSVLSQEGVDVRVLILDDCSTDDSEQVGRQLAMEDRRVEYRRHTVNKGHIATYNEGIDWLEGDYCLLLSADDLLVTGALSRAVNIMEVRPEIGLTHGYAYWTSQPEQFEYKHITKPEVTVQTGLEFIRSRCEAGHNLVECPTAVGRTAVQRKVGFYQPKLPHSGDMEMWLRYAVHSSIAKIHTHQAYYRTHGQNMSTVYKGVHDLQHIRLAFDSFFTMHKYQLPMCKKLKKTAYRAIGQNAFEGAYECFRQGNAQLFAEFVELAREVDPRTRYNVNWLKLTGKQILGYRLWNKFRVCRRLLDNIGYPRS